ncbi:MAG: hypothetical protein R3A51_22425, partial [Nannocystaceae bacterium]
ATGQLSISGVARFDGFFTAVVLARGAVNDIHADFEAEVLALAAVYGLPAGEVGAPYVRDLTARIKEDLDAHLEGGLEVRYTPPVCQASVSAALEAQAECEAEGECEIEIDLDAGGAAVECMGACAGTCAGTCSGAGSCAIAAPTVDCDGGCEGTCELASDAACDGTCHGTCDDACSAVDEASGECHGRCAGLCTGSCELATRSACDGTCHGTCFVDQDSPQCQGEVACAGACEGSCEGSCQGSFAPPTSDDCEASADCQAQASAQAEASLTCTPPGLELIYSFKAGLRAGEQAAFLARLDALELRGAAILQGFARLTALATGEVAGEVVFSPPPLAKLGDNVDVLTEGIDQDINIPTGRLPCVIPAFQEAAAVLQATAVTVSGTLEAQAAFASLLLPG